MKKFKQTKTTEYHCMFHNEDLVNANLPRNMSISDLSDSIIDDYKEAEPTISIPQGTKLMVLVNQDISLPPMEK